MMPPRVLASGPKPCGGNNRPFGLRWRNDLSFLILQISSPSCLRTDLVSSSNVCLDPWTFWNFAVKNRWLLVAKVRPQLLSLSEKVFHKLKMWLDRFWWNLLQKLAIVIYSKIQVCFVLWRLVQKFQGGTIWGLRNMKNPAFDGASLEHHKNKQIKPFY